jgi:UDP-N-acetylglucosamine 4-epimerase
MNDRFELIRGDIRDMTVCQTACRDIDVVLHQAALGSVPRSIADPLTTNAVNIDGFLNMLNAARLTGVKRFVYAASSSTYGDEPNLPKREDRIGNPLSPYAVTKLVDELYAAVFARTYGFNSIGLRYFNVFGPRQDPNGSYAAVIPKWAAAMIAGEDVMVNGDGLTSRDFCYVAPEEFQNQVYNVAVGDQTTLLDLVELLRDALSQYQIAWPKTPVFAAPRPGDVRHSLADISKASAIGYNPTHRLVDGIEASIAWYVDTLRPKIGESR